MSKLFAEDGSLIPNIRTQNYRITFSPGRTHTKIKSAEIVIAAESAEAAARYAADSLKLPMMQVTGVHDA
jgi:hypothetical protein